MFWKKKKEKINSEEYIELKTELNKLKLDIKTLEIDLSLYIRKLKISKGLIKPNNNKEEDDRTENESFNNSVILPT
jgi:hypothetical protein